MPVKTPVAPAPTRAAGAKSDRMVVVRYADGTILKGTTYDFAPAKLVFHVYRDGDETSTAVGVRIDQLKAVFYVKSYKGRAERQDEYDFERASGHGRKMAVRFSDGETIAGWTMGYNREARGFFMIPAEAEGNNARVYILNAAVESVTWL